MLTKKDLVSACQQAVDTSYESSLKFIDRKQARSARLCLEAVEVCQAVIEASKNKSALNDLLNICADICELCAEECERYDYAHSLRCSKVTRNCAEIARELFPQMKVAV